MSPVAGSGRMLVDLHAHYPMHVRARSSRNTNSAIAAPRTTRGDRLDAWLIAAAGRLWNYESFSAGPRVTVERMLAGGVAVAFSVLTTPLLEMGSRFTKWYRRRPPYGGPPEDSYFAALMRQLELMEHRVQSQRAGQAVVARSPAELAQAAAARKLALVHCVEGGYQLGASPDAVDRNVAELAGRGVAYITLAHLVWRHVATNVPAAPFWSDRLYDRLYPQPVVGLADLGRAAIRAMVREGVLIDVAHMSARSLNETFALLDELDPDRRVPVIASHVAYRFGTRAYNLDTYTVKRVAERDGIVGLILSDHYVADGFPRSPRSFDESFALLCRHIDQIAAITGSHRHVAIGSDLDGFVKPTLAGLEHSGTLASLREALSERYGDEHGALIGHDNALRPLREHWRQPDGSGRTSAGGRLRSVRAKG